MSGRGPPEGSKAANKPHSRNSSRNSAVSTSSTPVPSTPQGPSHAPQTPSRLRQSHAPGSSPTTATNIHHYTSLSSSPPQGYSPIQDSPLRSSSHPVDFEPDGIHPQLRNGGDTAEDHEATRVHGQIVEEHPHTAADASTRLLENYNHKDPDCGHSMCSHGTFSPRAESFAGRDSGEYEGRYRDQDEDSGERGNTRQPLLGDGLFGGRNTRPKMGRLESWMGWRSYGNGKPMSTTRWLTEAHGIKGKRRMYISYYIPFLNCELDHL
ncbi:MAG: hypothetical protein LQ340_004673 [Diploschistes diacapsis]|nr:MAG: hypothetical protein LQ340_004673 [Diploschistes diacapsis]